MKEVAAGLMIYESKGKALASLMGVNLSAERKRIIENAHAKKVWIGIKEGYEHLEKEDNPKLENEPESGFDSVDIDESMLPKTKKEEEEVSISTIAEMMDCPDGEGVQKKSVGKDGMPQEKTDLKGTSAKNSGGVSLEGGSSGLKSGDSGQASPEDGGGEGVQKKSVGKDGMPQEKTDLKDKKPSVPAMKEEEEKDEKEEIEKEGS